MVGAAGDDGFTAPEAAAICADLIWRCGAHMCRKPDDRPPD
jgi:hypothetical protein